MHYIAIHCLFCAFLGIKFSKNIGIVGLLYFIFGAMFIQAVWPLSKNI